MSTLTSSTTLQSEQEYFDRDARRLSDEDLRIREDQIERYRNARPHPLNIPKDALFAALLPLQGKRVLDYGCGTGDLACELALCGAEVTAFDLSPESVEKARRRAELHGVSERTTFQVLQAGQTKLPSASFDVIVGSAILHHLHTELPSIYAEIDRLLTADGMACFTEPVANSRWLRGLRRVVPVKSHATPDERQLRYEDFELMRRYFSHIEFQHFYCLERLTRVFGRRVKRSLRRLDHGLQQLCPFLQPCYGKILVIARR
jgi:2-polyprenyl-3-methyl-5-hydroxy-6-metoxy-1,4-benzoquinol methylase